jgi:2-polyprenyl-6-methoxyphenol hydroxylase-like FAD-dependent oxidoreductase
MATASTEVAVVGGGVVGMVFASLAARLKVPLKVTLVGFDERAPGTLDALRSLSEPDLRTFAITPSSARHLGPAWERMLDCRATPFMDMQVAAVPSASLQRQCDLCAAFSHSRNMVRFVCCRSGNSWVVGSCGSVVRKGRRWGTSWRTES